MSDIPKLIEEANEALDAVMSCPSDREEDYGPGCDVPILREALENLLKELKKYEWCSLCSAVVRKH